MFSSSLFIGCYAMAYGLKGFGRNRTSLRVRVERIEAGNVWVRTADLRDSGTRLVLGEGQVYLEELEPPVRHKTGLVEIG